VDVRKRLTYVYTLADILSVLENIEEIKRLHRAKAWEILLDRYSAVRRRLVSIQGSAAAVNISRKDNIVVMNAIGHFRTMEQEVERARSKKAQDELDSARLNEIASKVLDELNGVMISIRQAAE